MKVKGINHRSGEYSGNPYDNYILFGIEDNNDWDMVKVSAKVVEASGIKDIKVLLNTDVEILYNKFGKVESLRVK